MKKKKKTKNKKEQKLKKKKKELLNPRKARGRGRQLMLPLALFNLAVSFRIGYLSIHGSVVGECTKDKGTNAKVVKKGSRLPALNKVCDEEADSRSPPAEVGDVEIHQNL